MRVFVAVPVPREVRARAADAGKELAADGISLVRPENMHLTLRFVGEVQPSEGESIALELDRVVFKRFPCSVRGAGVFPDEHHVRVVWAGVESGGSLEALAAKVAQALKGHGGDQRFSAHLTIARVKRRFDAAPFLSKHRDEDFGSFEVSEFHLIESVLGGPQGPQYRVIRSYPAKG